MRLHDDLSLPVVVAGAELDWVASPAAGVDRRMLFRVGDEVARATSIVRYAPGSAFPRHVHTGGEEILVLDGVFQDEHGDYPAGSYLRNPPGTSHVPASEPGCTIFVRLWQFRADDQLQVVRRHGDFLGELHEGAVTRRVLFEDGRETVRLDSWEPNALVRICSDEGLEYLVVDGVINLDGRELGPQTWGRLPAGDTLLAVAGVSGVRLWIKDGPLLHANVCRLPG